MLFSRAVLLKALVAMSVATGLVGCREKPFAKDASFAVDRFGARGNSTSNDTRAIQHAIDSAAAIGGGTITLSPGTFLVDALHIRSSRITLRGSGKGKTILKRRAQSEGANVLDIGGCALGHAAIATEYVAIEDLTVDGSKDEVVQPLNDLSDWGIAFTRCSQSRISNVEVINCWNGGVGLFIDSNFNRVEAVVGNCGAGNRNGGGTTEPGVDLNSSKYNNISVVTKDCQDGFRMLDNCIGNTCDIIVLSAKTTGLIFNNQPTNICHGNRVQATVIGGCAAQAVLVGPNWNGNHHWISVSKVRGLTLNEVRSGRPSNGNFYFLSSTNQQNAPLLINNDHNNWNINISNGEGASKANHPAIINVRGRHNIITATLQNSQGHPTKNPVFFGPESAHNLLICTPSPDADAVRDDGVGNLLVSDHHKGSPAPP